MTPPTSTDAPDEAQCQPVNKWAAVQRSIGTLDPADEVRDRIDRTISGELRTIGSPWPNLSNLTQCLQPKTVTMLCGEPGSAKSLLLLQWCAWIIDHGETVSLLALECDRQFHLFRRLVQLSGVTELLDHEWVKKNGDAAAKLQIIHADALNTLGVRISEAPKMNVTYEAAIKWIAREAKHSRVLAIDPITALTPGDKPWLNDHKFTTEVSTIMKDTGSSLICVTHPGKQREKGAPSMKDLAGGAAYERFTDTILWIRNDGIEEVEVYGAFGNRETQTCNRQIRMCKTRNGRGAGFHMAMDFDKKSLTFRELGVIVEE